MKCYKKWWLVVVLGIFIVIVNSFIVFGQNECANANGFCSTDCNNDIIQGSASEYCYNNYGSHHYECCCPEDYKDVNGKCVYDFCYKKEDGVLCGMGKCINEKCMPPCLNKVGEEWCSFAIPENAVLAEGYCDNNFCVECPGGYSWDKTKCVELLTCGTWGEAWGEEPEWGDGCVPWYKTIIFDKTSGRWVSLGNTNNQGANLYCSFMGDGYSCIDCSDEYPWDPIYYGCKKKVVTCEEVGGECTYDERCFGRPQIYKYRSDVNEYCTNQAIEQAQEGGYSDNYYCCCKEGTKLSEDGTLCVVCDSPGECNPEKTAYCNLDGSEWIPKPYYIINEIGNCNDGIDNDCDGLVDFSDDDCDEVIQKCKDSKGFICPAEKECPNNNWIYEGCCNVTCKIITRTITANDITLETGSTATITATLKEDGEPAKGNLDVNFTLDNTDHVKITDAGISKIVNTNGFGTASIKIEATNNIGVAILNISSPRFGEKKISISVQGRCPDAGGEFAGCSSQGPGGSEIAEGYFCIAPGETVQKCYICSGDSLWNGNKCAPSKWDWLDNKGICGKPYKNWCYCKKTICSAEDFNGEVSSYNGPGDGFCVPVGQYKEDRYCDEKGNWTTRTRFIAEAFLDFINNKNDYVLYCDTPANALTEDGVKRLGNLLSNSNNYCVLRYDNKVAFGTALNKEIPIETFLNNIPLNPNQCKTILDGNKDELGDCNSNKKVWFNPIKKLTIYTKVENDLNLNPNSLIKLWNFISNSFISFINYLSGKKTEGFEVPDQFNKLYISKKNNKQIIGVVNEIKTAGLTYTQMSIEYTNFPDLCQNIIPTGINCEYSSNKNYIISNEKDKIDKYWQDLTSKLRIE